MKGIHESVLMSALRAFFVTFFGVLGITIALIAIGLTYYGVVSATGEEAFSSKVKILPDAEGKRKKLGINVPVLLQIDIDGKIGSGKITSANIEEILLASREDAFQDSRVKGVLLVIDSPGGGVNDSDIIYRLVMQYKERYKVPVFAYIDGLCASGGYYIACATDKIYASGGSLIGSIGVISWPPFVNLVDTLEKIGASTLTLSAGKGKDEMNPFKTWHPGEQDQYQSLINFYYQRFVDIVSSNRSLPKENITHELGAKVLPAPEALQMGLIDKSDCFRTQVLADLVKAAGIEGKYQVVGFETKSWWKKYLKEEPTSPLITGKLKHEFSFPSHSDNPCSYIFIP